MFMHFRNNIFTYDIKMAPPTAWNNAVKTAFKAGRRSNKNYSLKDAMFDAKKIYKKGSNAVANFGRKTRRQKKGHYRRRTHRGGETLPPKTVGGALPPLTPVEV